MCNGVFAALYCAFRSCFAFICFVLLLLLLRQYHLFNFFESLSRGNLEQFTIVNGALVPNCVVSRVCFVQKVITGSIISFGVMMYALYVCSMLIVTNICCVCCDVLLNLPHLR